MHRMREPDMDVVRFTESDVIVASGYLQVSGFMSQGTGSMTWNNTPYDYDTRKDLQNALRNEEYGTDIMNDGGDATSISSAFSVNHSESWEMLTIVENHLFKDTHIDLFYDDGEKLTVYSEYTELINGLLRHGKEEMVKKVFKTMNEHFIKLRDSDREEEREFYPGKTAEEMFLGTESESKSQG